MIDMFAVWPPSDNLVSNPSRRRAPRLGIVRNNIRQSHNYRVLDHWLMLAGKVGHVFGGWTWATPNTAVAECRECAAVLVVDTYAERHQEGTGTAIERPCL